MRTICLLATFCAMSVAARSTPSDIVKKLAGTWQRTRAFLGESPMKEADARSVRIELTEGKYKYWDGDKLSEGTWSLPITRDRPPGKPIEVNITGTKGQYKGMKLLGIFDLRGDRLRLCYDLTGKTRPTSFKPKKKSFQFLSEFRRVK